MIKPVSKHTLFESITNEIIQLVDQGQWTPGEKIPGELELAQSFQVSRNILREALKSLEMSGILEAKAGRGTFLSSDALKNIKRIQFFNSLKENNCLRELMETRLVIEPGLGRLAAQNVSQKDLDELEEILKGINNSKENGKYELEESVKFHMTIAKLSNNNVLYTLLNSIIDEISAQRLMYINQYSNRENLTVDLDEHIEIYNALKDRNGNKVYNLLYSHISKKLEAI